MGRRRPFVAIGITGGIASGKTLVSGYFEREGIPVIDADTIGHELIAPGAPCYRPLVRRFGRGILGRGGRVDRRRLGEIVFASPARRRSLNRLLHPPILREAERRMRLEHERGGHPIVGVSAALLVEAGAARRFDRVVLVACRPEVQMRRLLRRRRLTREQARARLGAQITDTGRRRVAHYVIDNSGRRATTRAQVRAVARALRRLAAIRGLAPAAAAGRARRVAPAEGPAAAVRARGGGRRGAGAPAHGATRARGAAGERL